MNLETFKKAGVCFDYCRFAVVPEIPYVQDVLYAMHLSDDQKCYEFCRNNHATYIVNVGLVVAAVGYAVLCMEHYDEAQARKIIAEAIFDLTSPADRCLFNNALAEAAEVVIGKSAPSNAAARETLLASCGCAGCCETIRERKVWNCHFAEMYSE